jgi:hypothetical protein
VTTGATWKFTLPRTGLYRVYSKILFATTTAWAVGESIRMELWVDGALNDIMNRNQAVDTSGGADYAGTFGSTEMYGTTGSYLNVRVVQTSGGNLALLNNAAHNWIKVCSG